MPDLNIKMVDLKSQYLHIKEEIDAAVLEVIGSTAFINGPQVKAFAKQLAEYNKIDFAIPCGNGTDALQIAMMALGLKAGDEVMVPVHTYVATAEVIALLHLKPIFVDVNPYTFTIDPDQIRKKISSNTKAIVPVHLYGQCADMESIMKIAKEFNLYVIEDTAQAIGADYTFSNGEVKKAGTIGHIGTTSFFPSKNLGAYGDGGALLVNDPDLAEQCRMIGNHGQQKKYYHDIIGCNSRLDTIQAAILNVKLKYLDQYSQKRNEVAHNYDAAFTNHPNLAIPTRASYSTHVFHQYTLKVSGIDRDLLKEKLNEKGIPSMIYYPVPLHLQKAYINYGDGEGSFPVSENLSRVVISLPIHTEMKKEEQNFIIETILETTKNLV